MLNRRQLLSAIAALPLARAFREVASQRAADALPTLDVLPIPPGPSFVSYESDGSDDLSDLIYNIAPSETPFIANVYYSSLGWEGE
jgi:hypothetical protein